jgi:hypothetical protein
MEPYASVRNALWAGLSLLMSEFQSHYSILIFGHIICQQAKYTSNKGHTTQNEYNANMIIQYKYNYNKTIKTINK